MPLHLAYEYGAPLEVLAALLEVWPDTAKEKDTYLCTSLHDACEHGALLEVLAALLEVWPDAAKEKDTYLCTPLHILCEYGAPLEVVSALLQVWPDDVKEKSSMAICLFIFYVSMVHHQDLCFLYCKSGLMLPKKKTYIAVHLFKKYAVGDHHWKLWHH
eukprot:15366075-Ditylum_brightwellii.AAC.1